MSEAELTRPGDRSKLFLLPLAVLVIVYLPTLYDLLVDWWTDSNYSHGFLVPFISFYLIWSQRRELAQTPVGSRPAALIVIVLGLGLFIVGTAAAEYFTARLSFVMLLFGLTWYMFGDQIIRRIWFAFFFLCFMIPVPYVIYYAVAFPLQLTATKITVGILTGIGMGVVREGNIIHLAGGHSLEVAEACSGMRSLVALLALGAVYAYWSQKNLAARTILFLSTVPIAIAVNVIRVLITTILVATVSVEVTGEPMHTIMGLLIFVMAYLGLFLVGAILKKVFQ